MECGTSVKREERSGVWGVKWRVWSVKCEVWSLEWKVESVKRRV